MIGLRKGASRLEIDPRGAYIRSWTVGRHVGLYSDPNKLNRATHPCGPNFGALSLHQPKDGKYMVDGTTYDLPQHGFLRAREWQVLNKTSSAVTLGLESTSTNPDEALLQNYPFYFRFTMSCRLTEQQLHYRLAFTGCGRPAPIDLASHTYHPWEPGMTIDGLSGLQYTDAADPRGIVRTFKGNDFGEQKDRDWQFRSKYHRSFTLKYPTSKKEISLHIGTTEDDIPVESTVVWSKPSEGQFICLEPVFVGPNSLNRRNEVVVSMGQTASLSYVLNLKGLR